MSASGNPAMDKHCIQVRIEIRLVVICYRNQDNLQPNEPLGLYADLLYNVSNQDHCNVTVSNYMYLIWKSI